MIQFVANGLSAALAVLAIVLVWRLSRVPVRGDAQMQLLWRGALAGLFGEMIGVSLSLLLWRPNVYWYLGYVYWLLISVVLGLTFTFSVWGVQKMTSRLSLPARAAVGGIIGSAAAAGWAYWAAAPWVLRDGTADTFGRSVVTLIVITGVVSGILAGPLEAREKLT